MSEQNQWERATQVWDRFIAAYPGHKGGVWSDPIEGPVWVMRGGSVVTVTHREPYWSGHFHIREPAPEQVEFGL